ncbi:MAG: IS110 family transposase [Acidiferrobacterales bacterium]
MLANFEFTAHIGIDWSDTKHDICIQPAGSDEREFERIPHDPKHIEQWAHAMHQRFGGPIAVVLELSKGPLVYALQKYDFFVLFPINPSMLAKYREAFKPSRAKDDPTDAELAVDLVLRHRERFKPLRPQSVEMRTLLHLVEKRRRLVADRIRFSNRLTNALKEYFPQAVEWFDHKETFVFCAFIARWPTLKQVKRARRSTLERFFHQHNVRRPRLIEARIQAIKTASALTDDPAVIEPCTLEALALAEQLKVTLELIKRFDAAIAELAPTLPDYSLFSTLPGAGAVFTPRLLVAFGEDRERFQSADEIQRYCGIAPVTERSGNKSWVHWRWQCPSFVRQTFVEWAAKTVYRSFWAGTYYRQQRNKGATHQVAVRALAFKWIRILYRCWQSRTPYNETVYLQALQRRGSSLVLTRFCLTERLRA